MATNTFGYDPKLYPYKMGDVQKAKQLMAEAGYAGGFDTPLFLYAGRTTTDEPSAVLIQEAPAQIGIRTTIERVPAANWRANQVKKEMPLFVDHI